MGVPIKGRTLLFGDNQSMVKNVTLPQSTLKKRHNAVAYHKVRQSIAAGFIGVVHCRSEYNLADWGTKAVTGKVHQHLLNNQTYPPSSVREYQADFGSMTNVHQIGHYATQKRLVDGLRRKFEATKDPDDKEKLEQATMIPARLYLMEHSQVDRDVSTAFMDQRFLANLI